MYSVIPLFRLKNSNIRNRTFFSFLNTEHTETRKRRNSWREIKGRYFSFFISHFSFPQYGLKSAANGLANFGFLLLSSRKYTIILSEDENHATGTLLKRKNAMKNAFLSCLLALFLSHLAGCQPPQKVEIPPAAVSQESVQTDAELERLMAMVVPYEPDSIYVVPEDKRFLCQLDLLINQDLAGQSEEYKLAVRKLALRHALAMNPMVDSIEVRRYAAEGWRYSESNQTPLPPSKTQFSWHMGGVIDRLAWDGSPNHGAATAPLFIVANGAVTEVDLGVIVDACGGVFDDCCANLIIHSYHDDAWLKDLADLGMAEHFPFMDSEITQVGLKYLAERKATNPLKRLCLTGTKLTPKELEPLAKLDSIEEFIFITKTQKINAAIFELLPNFPNLRTLKLSPGKVTKSQMEKLAQCQELQKLVLTPCQPETADAFEPLNRLKELNDLSISTENEMRGPFGEPIIESIEPGSHPSFAFSGEKFVLSDLPKLSRLSLRGFQNNTVELCQLPALQSLIVDADVMKGDILSDESQSGGLQKLFVPGGKLTESQVRALAKHPLQNLGLHNLQPENLNIFALLKDVKRLKTLSLQFSAGVAASYGEATLMIDVPKLQFLRVDFQEKNDVLLDLQNMKSVQKFYVKFLSHITLPPHLERVHSENANMSYKQFQIFQTGSSDIARSYYFNQLVLTDVDADDLFDDWIFAHNYTIAFDKSMNESLKGKTLHLDNCGGLATLTLQIPEPEENNVKLSNLPKLDRIEIRPKH